MGEKNENLPFKSAVWPTSGLCVPLVQESVPDNVKGGQDCMNTAPPTRVQ